MYRLMLVRFNRDSGEFEDQEFNRFCREHNVVRIEKEFINSDGNIYYSFFHLVSTQQVQAWPAGSGDSERTGEDTVTGYLKIL